MYNVTVKDPNVLGWLSWPGINLNMGVALCGRVYAHNQHLQYTNISWIWFHWPSNHTNRLFQLFTCFVTLFPNSSDSRCSFTVSQLPNTHRRLGIVRLNQHSEWFWDIELQRFCIPYSIPKRYGGASLFPQWKWQRPLMYSECIISKASQIFKWGFLEQVKCSHITLQPKTGSHWS